jgi:hypothetical protein
MSQKEKEMKEEEAKAESKDELDKESSGKSEDTEAGKQKEVEKNKKSGKSGKEDAEDKNETKEREEEEQGEDKKVGEESGTVEKRTKKKDKISKLVQKNLFHWKDSQKLEYIGSLVNLGIFTNKVKLVKIRIYFLSWISPNLAVFSSTSLVLSTTKH